MRDNVEAEYYEYRQGPLAIGATSIVIGEGEGAGSSRLRIDTGSVQTTLKVLSSGFGEEQDRAAVRWTGSHASNQVHVYRGEVGIAPESGETATVNKLILGYVDNETSDSNVYVGSGVTIGSAPPCDTSR